MAMPNSAFGTVRKACDLLTDFRSPPETGHLQLGHPTAGFPQTGPLFGSASAQDRCFHLRRMAKGVSTSMWSGSEQRSLKTNNLNDWFVSRMGFVKWLTCTSNQQC